MISENKIKHSFSVARQCRKIAEILGKDEDVQDACFVMGLLHDIGYEKCEKPDILNHPERSAEMLLNFIANQYACVKAIKDHGKKYEDLNDFDFILNMADMTVNHEGKTVSTDERLAGIKEYWGEEAEHYKNAVAQVRAIKKYYAERENE